MGKNKSDKRRIRVRRRAPLAPAPAPPHAARSHGGAEASEPIAAAGEHGAAAGEPIAEFYRRHPYPRVDAVWLDKNLLEHFRYLSATCPSYARGQPLRVLVAGAGTTEALTWALSLPDATVDALDVSDTSLGIARRLAAQLGVTNVRFSRADFGRGQGLAGPYDVISCLGVLHHLADPARGLAELERHLAPNGLLVLMVYTETHRRLIEDAQRVIGLLTRGLGAEAKEASARRIVDHGRRGPGRLSGTFQVAAEDAVEDPPSFADTMLNPREVSYSIPALAALLGEVGLEIVSPTMPLAWRPHHLLSPEDLARWEALPLLERLEVSDLLRSPVGSVLVRRREERAPPRPCAGDRALFWRIVPRAVEAGAYRVRALVVDVALVPERVDVEPSGPDTVILHRTPRHRHEYHRLAVEVLMRANGRRTLGEITREAAASLGFDFAANEDALVELLEVVMDEHALMTPDVAACASCPARAVRGS